MTRGLPHQAQLREQARHVVVPPFVRDAAHLIQVEENDPVDDKRCGYLAVVEPSRIRARRCDRLQRASIRLLAQRVALWAALKGPSMECTLAAW
jgi:hypothetical protein